MPKTIEVELSKKSIEKAIEELQDYKKWLQSRMSDFVSELLRVGIKMAYSQVSGDYKGYVQFTSETKIIRTDGYVVEGTLIGSDKKPIMRSVMRNGQKTNVAVSGILMSEFGSGWLSYVLDDVPGVGQGTFPGQTHAEDVGGWWYTDESGKRQHTYGETPTYPMHNAFLEMMQSVDEIGKRVFGNGY